MVTGACSSTIYLALKVTSAGTLRAAPRAQKPARTWRRSSVNLSYFYCARGASSSSSRIGADNYSTVRCSGRARHLDQRSSARRRSPWLRGASSRRLLAVGVTSLGFQCAASPRTVPGAARRLLRSLNRVARLPARRFWRCAAANTALPKLVKGEMVRVAPTKARAARAGAPGGVLATHPGGENCAPTSNIGDELPLRAEFFLTPQIRAGAREARGRATGHARAWQPVAAAARGSPSRQPRKDGAASPSL